MQAGFQQRARRLNPLAIFIFVVISGGLLSCQQPTAPRDKVPWLVAQAAEHQRKTHGPMPSEMDLQTLVLMLADEYMSQTNESNYRVIRPLADTTQKRFLAQAWLANSTASVMSIAVSPDPSLALLDLLVFVRLQRITFESHWMPNVWDGKGQAMLKILRRLENETWEQSATFLDPQMRQTLNQLIDQWIADHPERFSIEYVRFDQFLNEEEATQQQRRQAAGLLAQVQDASVAIDDARLLGERMLWFAGRFPMLASQRAVLSGFRLIDQPEIHQALTGFDQLGQDVTGLQQQIAALSQQIRSERQAALKQADQILTQQRQAILKDLETTGPQLRQTLEAADQTAKTAQTLVIESQKLTASMQALTDSFNRQGIEPGQINLTEVQQTLKDATATLTQLNTALTQAQTLLESPQWQDHHTMLDRFATETADAIFIRGLILVVALIVGLALLRLIPVRRKS